MLDRTAPAKINGFRQDLAILINHHFQQLLGRPLLNADDHDIGALLYKAPFAVLAHDDEAEPIFFYANLKAQEIFEMHWDEFTKLPSKLSAEPINQAQRQELLEKVSAQGYIDNYSGIRISKTGQRFRIENAIVWNLYDANNMRIGQAATFNRAIA